MPDEPNRDLVDRITDFLHYQKEVYGHFQIPEFKFTGSSNVGSTSPKPDPTTIQSKEQNIVQENPTAQPTDIYERVKQCNSLEELYQICVTADVLRTDLPNTNLVFGVGNPFADLLIIGEAPGQNEDIQKEPFVGRAGQLLNKILAAISFKRSDIYIANILKHRPPNNRDPNPDERHRSLPFLLKQIELIDPKIILCLGRISAQTLLKTNQPMKAMRGKFMRFMDKYDFTVTYHPAALLRNPQWKRGTWEDVQMVRKRYDELGGKP